MDVKVIPCNKKMLLQLKHKSRYLQKAAIRCVCCGASGSGKSHSLRTLIPMLHKALGGVHLFGPDEQPQYKMIAQWCKQKGIDFVPHEREELEPNSVEEFVADNIPKIVILDDCDLHDKSIQKCVYPFFTRTRASNCSVFLVYQSQSDIPKIIRNNSNMYVILRFDAPRLFDRALDLINVCTDNEGKNFIKQFLTKNPYSFLMYQSGECPFSSLLFTADGRRIIDPIQMKEIKLIEK